MITYKVKNFKFLTQDLLQVFLQPLEKSMIFQAGQYVEVLYPDGTYAPFSIANAPNKMGEIELHIRCSSNDVALADFIKHLQQKDNIVLRGPYGKAFYRATPENPIIILVGGTGFAYAKALIEQAIVQKDKRQIHLYWNAREASDFYLFELPIQWQKKLKNFHYTRIASQAKKGSWTGKIGYAKDYIVQDYPDLSSLQIYASGPPAMVASAYQFFQQYGLQAALMYSDML